MAFLEISTLGGLTIAGVVLLTFGFFFEAVGDWQLARSSVNPANKGQSLWMHALVPQATGR